LARSVRRVERASGTLATSAVARMDETLPWYRAMPAEQRSWVGVVAQAGIAAFLSWLRRPDSTARLTGEVFGAAPRELIRAITLQQTVALVRVTIEVVEDQVAELAAPGEEDLLREAVLRYSREIAFAAADVYAGAAERRGAWDARLEALLVDALLREDSAETLASRAAALGWAGVGPVAVAIGSPPPGDVEMVLDGVQRAARHARRDVLAGVHGDRLVVAMGAAGDPAAAVRPLLGEFASGPVVVGPPVADLSRAGSSARAALSGLRVVGAWLAAPRPVAADDLLPERALDGDALARRQLCEQVYAPLRAEPALLETLSAYLDSGRSVESTARTLFVHPNTVRYRLRRVAERTGLAPLEARHGFALQVALALGRLEDTSTLPRPVAVPSTD